MQRLILALMAIGSLLVTSPTLLKAQDDGKAFDPARGPHAIDEPAPPPHLRGSTDTLESKQMHIPPTAQVASDGPGAEGNAGKTTSHVVRPAHAPPLQARKQQHQQQSWFLPQLALLILGLLGSALSVIVTPNASRKVADHVASNARRDLRMGAFIGAVLLAVLLADSILLKVPLIRVLWAPIGIMVAFAPLLLLGFGWLAAMRWAGDCVARKLNHSGDGSTFGRMTLGLFAFFLVNVVLGSLNRGLGVIGLCVEIAVALMGIGATVTIAAGSGFGRRA